MVPYTNIMHLSQGVSISNDDTNDIESHRSKQLIQFNRSRRVLEFLIFELIEILPEISITISNMQKKRQDIDVPGNLKMKKQYR